MSEQLAFDLPHRPALGAEDFLVSDCNSAAVRLIDSWPHWPHLAQVLVGPRGSGKTHLSHVWRLRTGASSVTWEELSELKMLDVQRWRSVLLEDVDRGAVADQALFHFLNLCQEQSISLLITSATPPAQWAMALPDLVSRARSLSTVSIGPPDDALLRAVLLKQFSDRQLDIEPQLIAYIATRMDRSMASARRVVAELDRVALAAGGKVTRALAAKVLAGQGYSDDA